MVCSSQTENPSHKKSNKLECNVPQGLNCGYEILDLKAKYNAKKRSLFYDEEYYTWLKR